MARYLEYRSKTFLSVLSILLFIAFVQYFVDDAGDDGISTLKQNLDTKKDVLKRYDLRILVIVYNRVHSLLRLLNSLNEAEYGSDYIKLEVWIDREANGNVDRLTLQAANSFTFRYGEYEVLLHPQHVGIYGQWFTTWKPDVNSSEIAVILEDDLTVSKYFWRYLKVVHQKYDKNAIINGYSLQGHSITFSETHHHAILRGPKDSFVVLFPVLGTWGFSPSTKNWKKFLDWFENQDINTFKPYVPGNIATGWYKTLSRQGRANTMWSMWHIYYAWKNNESTLHCNFPDSAGLTTNWREKGLHFAKTEGSSNKLITEWKTEYENLSDHVPQLDLSGKIIHN
ncbi:uncharacterized protein LOC123528551 [Mercenaria mercenaria]|uniref:uncharacterized protein LOC123528551 n=1 Tax=Mercenaria mercenaria TaxID=6596 RepID=UPI00234E56CE|nr:uncharacterized protein LOC123528551 [Mercenaria mercenaria]